MSCLSLRESGLGSHRGVGCGSGTGPSHARGLDPSWSSTNTPSRQLLAPKHRFRASSGKFDFGQPFPGLVGIDAADPRSRSPSHQGAASGHPAQRLCQPQGTRTSPHQSCPSALCLRTSHRQRELSSLEPQVAAKCSGDC